MRLKYAVVYDARPTTMVPARPNYPVASLRETSSDEQAMSREAMGFHMEDLGSTVTRDGNRG